MDIPVYAEFYRLEERNWWFRGTREIQLDMLKRGGALRDGGRALDVGCGTGLWMKDLSRHMNVAGVDIAPEALEFCRNRGLKDLHLAGAQKLPFPDATFDVVTANGVIEHLDDDSLMASELARVLKPGGFALLLTSAYQSLWSAHDDVVHHKRRYTRGSFKHVLLGAGLAPIQVTYVTTFIFPGVAAVRGLQRFFNWKPRPEDPIGSLVVPAPINWVLLALLRIERAITRVIDLPFGVNIVALARKP